MTSRSAAALIALLLAQSPSVAGPPDKVAYEDDPTKYIWVSVDTVLTPEGGVRKLESWGTHLERNLRWKLDQAKEWFGPDHARGLVDGTTPPEELCAGHRSATISFAGPETNDFALAAMLSEVIVEATVATFSLGFLSEGTPGALLMLEEVKPLRNGSPIPVGAVVPIPRLVVRGGVFCGDVIGSKTDQVYRPKVGGRVILMGSWSSSGLTLLHPKAGNGAFAEVDGEKLKWGHLTAYEPPETHGDLLDLLDGMHRRGLMAMSLEAARKGADPREREEFLSEYKWRYAEPPLCRLDSAEMVDGEWVLRERCADPESPEH